MSQKLKYACVGAGGIADRKHLNEYSKLNDVEIAAVCGSTAERTARLAEKYGIKKVYTDYLEMLDSEKPDFISICTPNYLHAPVTLAALERGIHVHCEKPLALNESEARSIVDAKNKAGRKVMIALNFRFLPEIRYLKKCAEEGYFGEIYHIRCEWRRRNGIPGRGVWFTDKKLSGGGVLIDLGTHFLDLAMHFLGYPKAVSVLAAAYSKFGNIPARIRPGYRDQGEGIYDVEDMALGVIKLSNGAAVSFEFSWAANVEKETKSIDIMGTKGGASFRDGEVKLFSQELDMPVNVIPDISGTVKFVHECRHFVDCLKSGNETWAPPEDGLALAGIIDAAYRSAESGREVVL